MEQMQIIQNMLDAAKKHNLEMECIISMINDLIGVTDEELKQACANALNEWDI
jgi:hypothetical protein